MHGVVVIGENLRDSETYRIQTNLVYGFYIVLQPNLTRYGD